MQFYEERAYFAEVSPRQVRRRTLCYGATRCCAQLGGLENMRFCETNPFVMLANSQLTDVKAISYLDYRKLTNGFVFEGIGGGVEEDRRDGALKLWGSTVIDRRYRPLTGWAGGRYEGGSVSGREFTL